MSGHHYGHYHELAQGDDTSGSDRYRRKWGMRIVRHAYRGRR